MTVSAAGRIGPFEVIAPLGAGGMGEVFRARDPRIGRGVAIKVLPAEFARDNERLHRFEQEARAAGSLSNPNLVTIFELGTHEGAPYIAMELLEGSTLREKLRGGRTGDSGVALPQRKAVDIAMQIANGLAAAHEKGLVHRDIKPENIFLTRDGQAKILDFGIVKLMQPLGPAGSQLPTVPKTSPGMVVGTTSYMSPEQVAGEEVDHRSDIFSLGLVLYEMLAGRRAFQAATPVDTMSAILHDDPAPLSAEGHVSASLENIVMRCLEKEPRQRFGSARDLMFALEAVGEVSSESAPRMDAAAVHGTRAHAVRVSAIAATALAALAGAFWLGHVMLRPAPPPVKRIPKIVRLTWEPGRLEFPVISPDGTSFAYVTASNGNSDIQLRRIGGDLAINLTKDSPGIDTMPAFSPDGQSIAFYSARDGGGIFLMGPTGESVRRLTDFGFEPAWSPDGKSIAISTDRAGLAASIGSGELWIVDVATGTRRKIFAGPALHPCWSPSGSRIAFHWIKGMAGGFALATIPASGGEPVAVVDLESSLPSLPVWTRDGIVFARTDGGIVSLWRVAVDERTGTAAGSAEPVLRSTANAWMPSSTADGRRILFLARTRTIKVKSYNFDASRGRLASGARDVLTTPRDIAGVRPSPDGEWIAAVLFDQEFDDTVLIRVRTGELRRLTQDTIRDQPISWAADGSKLYLWAAPEGKAEIWSIRPDGSDRALVVSRAVRDDIAWGMPSSDGRWFYATVTKRRDACAIDLAAPLSQRKAVPLPGMADGRSFELWDISPDGRWAVGYPVDAADKTEPVLWLLDVARKTYRELADLKAPHRCAWLPDSRRILLWRNGELQVLDRETGAITPAGSVEETAQIQLALSRDGRFLFSWTRDFESDVWMLDYGNAASAAAPQVAVR